MLQEVHAVLRAAVTCQDPHGSPIAPNAEEKEKDRGHVQGPTLGKTEWGNGRGVFAPCSAFAYFANFLNKELKKSTPENDVSLKKHFFRGRPVRSCRSVGEQH